MRIKMLISDVDGTLVTPDKQLTPATLDAVRELQAHGVLFTVTSSRPPMGLRMLTGPLNITLPMGPFNGSSIVNTDLSVVEMNAIPKGVVVESLARFERDSIDAWIFTDANWIIDRDDGRYVQREKKTIQTDPLIARHDDFYPGDICKVVGVTSDFSLLARCESELQALLGARAHVALSQDYYLDVTPPGHDKGTFVAAMSKHLNIPREAIATIGDMTNDLPLFRAAGMSFAMGNAPDAVKAKATNVTASNTDEGFAKAVEYVLDFNKRV